MHVVIGGCGRVGANLAHELVGAGHDVVVIDKDRRSFRRLGEDFPGRKLHGIVFDRDTLEEGGIRKSQAFIAVTSGDNSNIVAARTAHERYGVERVVARIYDPARAGIYERFGITTIASAQWTSEEILRSLLPAEERVAASLGPGHGDVVVVTLAVPHSVHAAPSSGLQSSGELVLVAVTREGRTTIPAPGALLEAGDRVHLAVQRDAVERARQAVAALGGRSR